MDRLKAFCTAMFSRQPTKKQRVRPVRELFGAGYDASGDEH